MKSAEWIVISLMLKAVTPVDAKISIDNLNLTPAISQSLF